MTDEVREYPYVDEHEFNCDYILNNKEKPDDLSRKVESRAS